MLARMLLSASAALQAWYLHAASLAPRFNDPREAVNTARWTGLLAFALAVAGGILSIPELRRAGKARGAARVVLALATIVLSLWILGARTSNWQSVNLQRTAVWEVILAVLALLS